MFYLHTIWSFFFLLVTHSTDVFAAKSDILVTNHVGKVMLEKVKMKKRDAIREDIFRWKGGVVPYVISSSIDSSFRSLILESMEEVKRLTCINFKEKSYRDKDYVKFDASQGCFSAIGRQGGEQTISLGDGCQTYGHVLHEIMHCLGFFHEQSRFDRDLYIRVLWWNIADGALRNFATYSHGKADTLGAPYDKQSILHYGNQAFSKNGGDTVESIDDPKEVLGRQALSNIDIIQVNKLYGCYKNHCNDKSPLCTKFLNKKNECFWNTKVSTELCKKSCGFC